MPPATPSRFVRARRLLAAALLPQPCQLCGGLAGAWPVCAGCAAELPGQPADACPQCGEDNPAGGVCAACIAVPPPYAATFAALRYRPPVDRLLIDFKFHGALHLAPWFAELLAARVPPGCDAVVAMPLHAGRLAERGFNQAREIAAPLARRLALPLLDGVRRTRATAHQADLDAEARRRNVRGAFACTRRFDGLHLLLVDDVMTTGGTVAELSATLLAAGAGRISVAVAARTPQR